MQLIMLITNHGKSDVILKYVNSHIPSLMEATSFMGKGTATSEILDALSLDSTDKDVVFMLVNQSDVKMMFDLIEEKFNFTKKGKGVACAINLNGISAQTLQMITQEINGGQKV